MRLMNRDYLIMKEIDRWRYCLGRHIKYLIGFSGQRATDNRLKKLIDAGYLERKRYIYGIPGIYTITKKACELIGINFKSEKIRLEQIHHNICVLDCVIYFTEKYNIDLSDIISEKQLHQRDGFGVRKHRPDFVFEHKDNKKLYCVEVELTAKSKDRLVKNVYDNYMNYDYQLWVVNSDSKIAETLIETDKLYPLHLIDLEKVRNHDKKP